MMKILNWSANWINSKKKNTDNFNDITRFLVDHPSFAIRMLSAYYPFTAFQLNKYGKFLHWKSSDSYVDSGDRDESPTYYPEIQGLSSNNGIIWNIELLHEFKDQVNWKNISRNPRINWWSKELLREFANDLDWRELSSNNGLRISSNVIDEFKDYWKWDSTKGYRGLSKNGSLEWNQKKIERFSNFLNWDDLSSNPNLKWHIYETNVWQREIAYDKSILKLYENSWNYKNLSTNKSLGMLFNVLSDNEVMKLLDYQDWDWKSLSGNNSLPWSEEFINANIQRICWKEFCGNEGFNWTEDFIARNINNIDWTNLSANGTLPWSIAFIEKYKEYLDWDKLSVNGSLPWGKKLLKKYRDKWNWGSLSSITINWDKKLLAKFKNRVNWETIVYNERLNIDYRTINKYASHKQFRLDKYTMIEFIVKPKPEWDTKILYDYLDSLTRKGAWGYYDGQSSQWNDLINNNNLYNEFFSKFINDSNIDDLLERLIKVGFRDNYSIRIIRDILND